MTHKGKDFHFKWLVWCVLLVGMVGCKGGSDPCEGTPYTDHRVVTGFTFQSAVHHTLQATGSEGGGRYTKITLMPTTALAEAFPAPQSFDISLFAKASATSCVYLLPEKITGITLTSSADYHHHAPAGLTLNHLFHYEFMNESVDETLAQGSLELSGMPLDFVLFEQPTASLQHQFTFEIELDSGSRFTLVTDTVEFESAAIQ